MKARFGRNRPEIVFANTKIINIFIVSFLTMCLRSEFIQSKVTLDRFLILIIINNMPWNDVLSWKPTFCQKSSKREIRFWVPFPLHFNFIKSVIFQLKHRLISIIWIRKRLNIAFQTRDQKSRREIQWTESVSSYTPVVHLSYIFFPIKRCNLSVQKWQKVT